MEAYAFNRLTLQESSQYSWSLLHGKYCVSQTLGQQFLNKSIAKLLDEVEVSARQYCRLSLGQ